ncbi:hypothetical protein [Atlantibacter hermannii]|uniref:hypothetical protein n=1 Tax=Atlantibacter hermannii TaxID=565 RepID=UPI0028A28FB0|nr:hypothetical protein [Atlantibacter hermannii]
MGDKTKHLVRVGHEFAAAMSDDTPIITIAKMVTELASALDVQSARSDALAVDNSALNKFIKDDCWIWDDKSEEYFDAADCMPETPATGAWLNEQRAVGVDGAIEKLITMLNHQSTGVSASINVLRTFAAQLRGSQV